MLKMKLADQELTRGHKDPNTIAVELGLVDKGRHEATQKIRANRYHHLLNLVETLITRLRDDPQKSNTYTSAFEEDMRELYQTTGYHMYTVDRLISQIVKHVQTMLTEHPTQQLLTMFWADRKREVYSPRQEARYRMEAEKVLGEGESVFRLEYVLLEKILLVQLLGKDDLFADTTISSEEKWSLYVEGFTQLTPTIGARKDRDREPFLKRSLPNVIPEEPPTNVETISGLELKICLNTYRIFFVENTEDYFARRRRGSPTKADVAQGNLIRANRFRRWEEERITSSARTGAPITVEKNDGLDLLLGQGSFQLSGWETHVVAEGERKVYLSGKVGEGQAGGSGGSIEEDTVMG
ncbi:Transcriptional regulatory protein sin3 [Gonapodya sp. JEL0774]|nr:Transcriptional regulatory protein sin3 [Gonapodya sp. JEL0774]